MYARDIVVIGASAGGVEALTKLVRNLPVNLPASLFIVLHIPPTSPDLLPGILNRSGLLSASHAVDGAVMEQQHIYIAPPDHHLLLEDGHTRVVRGPKENRHRPAIDPLFCSAAQTYGERVIGIILTGALDDGTAGLMAVKRQGGLALVQDPEEALYPGMPRSALERTAVDYCRSVTEIGQLLPQLVKQPVSQRLASAVPPDLTKEVRIATIETNPTREQEQLGQPSPFSCPECSGVLWERQDGTMTHFRCRTGHAFSQENVLAAQAKLLERALWLRRLARQARDNKHHWLVQRFEERIREAEQHAISLRSVLENSSSVLALSQEDAGTAES